MNVAMQQIVIPIGETLINCTVKRSKKRRRTLSLVLDPQEGIQVHIPWRTSAEYLQEFITSHHHWILDKVKQLDAMPRYVFMTGEQIPYLGQWCSLIVSHAHRATCICVDNQFHVTIKTVSSEKQRREAVYLQLKKWFYAQAREILPERLAFWQEQLGVAYMGLRITNPKRQWGCCHANNAISINWRIMLTTMKLVDYLVVHELCHIRHKNHSSNFWQMVESVLPDYRERRRALRKHEANYFYPESGV